MSELVHLKELNIREKQAYGAMCLAKFCANSNITHENITELIEHLLSILTAKNICDWEKKGSLLRLSGRGDDIPNDVYEYIPENLKDDFSLLVEYVVEIGIVDMYGDISTQPYKFLQKTLFILNKNGINPPDANVFIKKNKLVSSGWGTPIDTDYYLKVHSSLLNIITNKSCSKR